MINGCVVCGAPVTDGVGLQVMKRNGLTAVAVCERHRKEPWCTWYTFSHGGEGCVFTGVDERKPTEVPA